MLGAKNSSAEFPALRVEVPDNHIASQILTDKSVLNQNADLLGPLERDPPNPHKLILYGSGHG